MKRLQLLLLWVWMVCFSAASHDYMFKHLEVKDGLSNNQVNAIYKDSNGFMWCFGRAAVPVINDHPGYHFEIGKGTVVREGKDVTIVATGICVDSALGAAKMLEEEGISAEVVNICTIKPLDEEIIINSAKKTGKVVTVEEHSVIGGLGSAVCDCLCANHPVPVKKVGMQDVFGESGSAAALVEKYGLDAKGVYKSVKEFL